MAAHICVRCNKTLASRQSLWNHRQRCKDSKDGLHATLGEGLLVKSRFRSPPMHKEKFASDIINNVGKMQGPKSDTGKEDIVENILNKVFQRSNVDPMSEEISSLPFQEALKTKSLPDLAAKMKSGEPTSSEDETALKPKPLIDLPTEMKSDSEESTLSEDKITEQEVHIMPDNRKELKEPFRNLYKEFRRDIAMHDKLVLMLD